MIYGIGIDVTRIERIRHTVHRWGEGFLHRVFTENELAYCYKKRDPYPSLAVRFAAKEALIKAIGSRYFSLKDAEVINDAQGKPFIKTKRRLTKFFRDNGISQVHLSLTHESEHGIACVILEQGNEENSGKIMENKETYPSLSVIKHLQ